MRAEGKIKTAPKGRHLPDHPDHPDTKVIPPIVILLKSSISQGKRYDPNHQSHCQISGR